MNLSVEDLTVTGKIVFGDGSFLESSYSSLFTNFLNFERNASLGTTTLLSDKFLLSNSMESATEIITPQIRMQVAAFLNDYDDNNQQVFQTRGFSEDLRNQLIQTAIKMNFLTTYIIDLDNKSIFIENPFDFSSVSISTSGMYFSADLSQSSLTSSYFEIQNLFTTLITKSNEISLLKNNGDAKISLIQQNEEFEFINRNVQGEIHFSAKELKVDSTDTFTIDCNLSFLKMKTPVSLRVNYLLDGDYIEPYMSCICCENISLIKLREPLHYLDSSGNEGWCTVVSNFSGSDLSIDTNSVDYFSHSHQQQSSPIIIKKWGTLKIYLLKPSVGYIWAVAEF